MDLLKRPLGLLAFALFLASCGSSSNNNDQNASSSGSPPNAANNSGIPPSATGGTPPGGGKPDNGGANAGTGGGGTTSPGSPGASTTISGVVALGGGMGATVNGTTVNAYAIASGQKDRSLGSVTVSSALPNTGAYSINIGSYTGPVLLEASGGTYYDLATGANVPLGVPIRVALANASGNTSATISPLTEALVEWMLKQSGNALTPDAISAAYTAAKDLFSFDPSAVVPADPTTAPKPTAAGAYGVHMGVMSEMQKDTNATLASAIAAYADWLSAKPDAPSAIVSSADNFGFNLRNRSDINNFNALATLTRWLKSSGVPDTPSSATDSGGPGMFGYTLKIINDDPAAVRQFTVDELRNAFYSAYPAMATRFNSDAPKEVILMIVPNLGANVPGAVGTASDNTIEIDAGWLKGNPLDIDLITHEAFHILQRYRNDVPLPSWIIEGLADYGRSQYGLWNSITGWTMHAPVQGENYTDGYRVAARFFRWLEAHYGKQLLEHLNAAMRDGSYTDDFWVKETGHSVQENWADYSLDPLNR